MLPLWKHHTQNARSNLWTSLCACVPLQLLRSSPRAQIIYICTTKKCCRHCHYHKHHHHHHRHATTTPYSTTLYVSKIPRSSIWSREIKFKYIWRMHMQTANCLAPSDRIRHTHWAMRRRGKVYSRICILGLPSEWPHRSRCCGILAHNYLCDAGRMRTDYMCAVYVWNRSAAFGCAWRQNGEDTRKEILAWPVEHASVYGIRTGNAVQLLNQNIEVYSVFYVKHENEYIYCWIGWARVGRVE